jgi:imidazole glycerol-phosphate synthase subunit HisH
VTNKVTVVDYGVGNLFSVRGAVEHLEADVIMGSKSDDICEADRLLLPGVGAFADAMDDMRQRGLIEPVLEFCKKGRPLLGICLGMQMLFERSEEFGNHEGIGLVEGAVVAIPDTGSDGSKHRIPHVGWNELVKSEGANWRGSILNGIDEMSSMYFVHSFMASPSDASHCLAECHYNGRAISAVIQKDNIMGCQFHPEKSAEPGLMIVKEFLSL